MCRHVLKKKKRFSEKYLTNSIKKTGVSQTEDKFMALLHQGFLLLQLQRQLLLPRVQEQKRAPKQPS